MPRKISFNEVLREISETLLKREEVKEDTWQTLYDVAENFQQFADAHYWAETEKEKIWMQKFLLAMINHANRLRHWKQIAMAAKEGTRAWDIAIEKSHKIAREKNKPFLWRELRNLLSKDHNYWPEATKKS